MKKSNIEKQFVEKLSAREITPSAASWDRLDAMLSVAEKPKRNFKWLYVAACLVGFLLISSLFFNSTNETVLSDENQVVNNEAISSPQKSIQSSNQNSQENGVMNTNSNAIVVVEKIDLKKVENKNNPSVISQNDIVNANSIAINESKASIINQNFDDSLERSGKNQTTEFQIAPKKSSYVNADELLASVDPMHKKTTSKEFSTNVKVNSKELLSQVDGELELSFREKALQMVSKNIKTASVTLSNRNSQ
jgi:hypothetical protein